MLDAFTYPGEFDGAFRHLLSEAFVTDVPAEDFRRQLSRSRAIGPSANVLTLINGHKQYARQILDLVDASPEAESPRPYWSSRHSPGNSDPDPQRDVRHEWTNLVLWVLWVLWVLCGALASPCAPGAGAGPGGRSVTTLDA
jgi:hypothetical protein